MGNKIHYCNFYPLGSNKVLWESYLYLPVIPSHCGIKIGRSKRMEVKLHKEYNEQWSDLCSQYIRAVSSTTPNATPTTLNATPTTTLTTLNTTPTTFDTTPTISNAMPTTTPTMPNAMPATTPIVTPPFNAVPLSLVGNNTEEHNEVSIWRNYNLLYIYTLRLRQMKKCFTLHQRYHQHMTFL